MNAETTIADVTSLDLTATFAEENGDILVGFAASDARRVEGECPRNSVAFCNDPAVALTLAQRMAGAKAFSD